MKEQKKIGDLNCTIVNNSTTAKGAVILCHGFGAPGTDLVPIAEELIRVKPELCDIVFVFPQAPIELDPFYDSRAWWMIDVEKIQSLMVTGEFRELRSSQPAELSGLRKQMVAVLDHVREEFSLQSGDMIVGGFSQGAMLATDVALKYSEALGGLIVWSGTLINETEWIAAAKKRSPMSIVQSHGKLDPVLPFTGAEFLRDMFVECGHELDFIPFDGQHTIGMEAMTATVKLVETIL